MYMSINSDECLKHECFQPLLDAQIVIEDWRLRCNAQRSHRLLGCKIPADFVPQYITQIQPAQTLIPVGHKNLSGSKVTDYAHHPIQIDQVVIR
jgi:hypothetical protein